MDSFRLIKNKCVNSIMLVNLLCFMAPASAATNRFSFIDYNIAFILGLSLPILLLSTLLRPKISLRWGFPAGLTATLLVVFYSIAHLTHWQSHIILSASSIFLALSYLWQWDDQPQSLVSSVRIHITLIISALLLFNITIWLVPQLDGYKGWLLFSGLILLLAFVRIIRLMNLQVRISHLLIHWIFTAFFAVSLYFWLDAELNTNLLAITCVLTYLISLINSAGHIVHTINQHISINPETQTQLKNEQLFSYTHDPVTHLPNVQHAIGQIEQQFKLNEHHKYAIISIKPINFQQVNEVLGHQNSDILLLQLAYCLAQGTTNNPLLLNLDNREQPCRIARMLGLNFLMVYDLSSSHHPTQAVLEDFCHSISALVPSAMSFKSFSLNFDLAFGITLTEQQNESAAELIARAGDALLEAKATQQKICYFDHHNTLYTETQLAKMEALKQAIQSEDFIWRIEPQIQLSSKKITGLELNVQWQMAQQKPLLLTDFITLAELSGELYLLTKLMINEAFRTLAVIQKRGLYIPVTITIASKELLQPDLVDYIETRINTFNIVGKYLMLALDESIIVNAGERTKSMIDHLKALDINIAIADFSGSYEALRYIRKMAINEVKINCRQLVNNIENSTDKAIINTLINLTRKMHLPLVGTDIDNQSVEQAFSALGGDYIQGSIIGKSINSDALNDWLSTWFEQYPTTKP